MASPGWYPDPAGTPGAFRYWDGAAWGADVADNPYGPPPGSAAPPPTPPAPPSPPPTPPYGTPSDATSIAPGHGQQPQWQPSPPSGPPQPQPGFAPSYGATPSYGGPAGPGAPDWSTPSQPGGSGGSGRTVLLVLVAIIAVVALGIGAFFVVESLTDDSGGPDGSATSQSDDATDESSSEATDPTSDPTSEEPTTEPTTDPSESTAPVEPTSQQCTGGTPTDGTGGAQGRFLLGGGLKLQKIPGYSVDEGSDQAAGFPFADGAVAPSKVIEQNAEAQTGWVSVYLVGALPKANGFDSPEQAAEVVVACMAADPKAYQGFSGRTDLDSSAITVDGREAWQLDAELRIDNPDLQVEGDVAKVIVVDTGDPDTFGLFLSVVPIGDDALIAQQQQVAEGLQVP